MTSSVSRFTSRLTSRFTPNRTVSAIPLTTTRTTSSLKLYVDTYITHRLSGVSHRDRRTIMIGAVVVVAGVLIFRGIPAWRAWISETTAHAEALSQRLGRIRQQTAGAPSLQTTADSVAATYYALSPGLLSGDSPAQAAAALASHISETADVSGLRIETVQLVTDSVPRHTEIYRVRVRADATGDIAGVTTFLQLLESGGQPLLAVQTLSIAQSNPLATLDQAETLRISFVVEGIARHSLDP